MVSDSSSGFFSIRSMPYVAAKTTAVNNRIVTAACQPKTIPIRVPASGNALTDAIMDVLRFAKYWMMFVRNQPIRPPATQVTIAIIDGGIVVTKSIGR